MTASALPTYIRGDFGGFRALGVRKVDALLEVLRADYIRTARAKGLRETRVVWLHALNTAMVSILPILGRQAGFGARILFVEIVSS